jgi:hypothetical protein
MIAAPPGEPDTIAAMIAGAAAPGRWKNRIGAENIFRYAMHASGAVIMGISARKGSIAGATP